MNFEACLGNASTLNSLSLFFLFPLSTFVSRAWRHCLVFTNSVCEKLKSKDKIKREKYKLE